jgi:hypothetical protein
VVKKKALDERQLTSLGLAKNLSEVEVSGSDFPEVEGRAVVNGYQVGKIFNVLNG